MSLRRRPQWELRARSSYGHGSVIVFVCHSSHDREVMTSLERELWRYSYTPFSDMAASSLRLELHSCLDGGIENMDTCTVGLIIWSESFVKHFSHDTVGHLQTLAEHNIPVLDLLYGLNVSDLKDPEGSSLWNEPSLEDLEFGGLWNQPNLKDAEGRDLWSQPNLKDPKGSSLWNQPNLKDPEGRYLWSQPNLKDPEGIDLRSQPNPPSFLLGSLIKLSDLLGLVYAKLRSQLDPVVGKLLSNPGTNTRSAYISSKISKWVTDLDATNALVYDRRDPNSARVVADEAAHIILSNICPSNGEQMQDKEELCQDLKDMYTPEFQRDYHSVGMERKLVTVNISSEDSCDEIISMLAAELKEMSYDVCITGLKETELKKMSYDVSITGLKEKKSSLRLFVLSDSFLRREDCLMEVIKNADAPMISLFYNLSMSEFRDEKRRELWREEWSPGNKRNDFMANWERAVEVLGSCDGIDYRREGSNIKHYIQAVAKAVSRRVPLEVVWSNESSQVQGKIQMCEKVDALFQSKASLIHGGTQVLGVHGIWGVGKSSLGKAMCDFYSPEFVGRVCYVELGSSPLSGSSGTRLHRQKRLLQELFEADANFLECFARDLSQVNAYLDHRLEQAPKKVFLVIDNIQDSLQSFEEARDLFIRKFPFPRESKVLLLARSPHTLRGLLQPLESLSGSVVGFPWSILHTVHDQIFCQAVERAGGAQSSGRVVLDIFRDFFPKLCESGHPLTIKSFALFALSKDPLIRDLAQETEIISEHFDPHGKEGSPAYPTTWKHLTRLVKEEGLLDCVFETLQKSYDSFDSNEQQFFLDVALYMPSTSIYQLRQHYDYSDEPFSTTTKCLRKLRGEAFLMFRGREVRMPAACRCFAELMAQRDWSALMIHIARESVQWARICDNVLRATDLGRIALESCYFVQGNDQCDCFSLDLSSCKFLSVLRLWGNMSEKGIVVQLGENTVLKCLEVLHNTCQITVEGKFVHIECFKGDCSVLGLDLHVILPESLRVFEIFNPTGENIDFHHLTKCINVAVVRLHGGVSYDFCSSGGFISRHSSWDGRDKVIKPRYWISLKELVLEDAVGLSRLEGLDGLCNLRVLHLSGLNDLERVRGMEELGKLEEFHLLDCDGILSIKLPGGSRLRHCCIYRCRRLEYIGISKGEAAGKSGDSDDEEDEGLAEENMCWLQYDANMWRGWSKSGSLLLHPDGRAYGDRQQDECRRCFRFDASMGSVSFISGEQYVHKFKVWGCPLESARGLSALIEIQVFEFSQLEQRCGKMLFKRVVGDLLNTLRDSWSDTIRGFTIERGTTWLTGSAKLSYLNVAALDEEMMKYVREAGLNKLAIECGDHTRCYCEYEDFFSLPESVTELKFRCPRVCDLSRMSSLVQIRSLDLEGCKSVETWPNFSKMRSLSVLNLRNTSWKGPHPFNNVVPSPINQISGGKEDLFPGPSI